MVSTESAIQCLSEFVERQLPTLNAPGVAIGITNREHILYTCSYGLANREAGKPVTPETLFQIGSISKAFTSIVLLQLQEQRLLDINDPITKYLPWFEIQSKFEPITLRHLMSHTGGIIRGSDETISAYTETWNLRYTKATAPPGDMFHYSNSGYKILGVVQQTLLGRSIAEILHEHILKPLGMNATLPVIRSEDRSKLAVGYSAFYDDRPLPAGGLLAPATWLEYEAADGSICSNAEDMCRYLQALLQRGNGLLSQRTFEQLIEPIISTDDGPPNKHYGLGLTTQQIDGHHVIGHGGGMVGYTADLVADLDSGLGVVVLTNGQTDPLRISRYAIALLNAAQQGGALPEMPADDPYEVKNADDYSGTYHCGEKSFTLRSIKNRLYLDTGTASVSLQPHPADSYLVAHPGFDLFPLHIKRENGEIVEAFYGAERYVRGASGGDSSHEIPLEWHAYLGSYRSHNPWLNYFRVIQQKDELALIHAEGESEPLYPLEPGLFRLGSDPRSPEFIRFGVIIDGKAMQVSFSGGVYSRIFTP